MNIGEDKIENLKASLEKYWIKENILSPRVSVIIPCYNSEDYIVKCLSSLIKQTLKDIEIIVIDDGSSDKTEDVVKIFSDNDTRIQFIKQEHKKQGAARNKGLSVCKGEYIGFVDSDDWVDEDYYEKLYFTAKKYDSDIALAANVRIGNGKTKKRLNITEEKFVTKLQDKFDIGKQPTNPCPTNKIYKKSLLKDNNITWPEGVYCEDKLFTVKAVFYANGIVSVPNIYYYYFRNPKSTVNVKDKAHLEQINNDKNNARKQVLEFLKENDANIRDKDFWALEDEIRIFNVPVYRIKKSIKTKSYYIFGIEVFEKPL